MKTGIVTFHDADSFGAVLQAYALKTALEEFGVQAEFLHFEQAKPSPPPASTLILQRIRRESLNRHALFEDFRREHLCIVPFCPDKIDEYSLFIAGSDQVWNPDIIGEDSHYFLEFSPPEKRCSYAASFGSASLSNTQKDRFAQSLKSFATLSVREESGASILRELTGREAAVDIDPTLLIDPSAFGPLMSPPVEEDYILLITLQNNMPLLRYAREFAAQQGLALKVVSSAFFPPVGFYAWSGVSPSHWLRLIHDARLVITNSFHGVAFSIIFERDFYFSPLVDELKDRNVRVSDLMGKLGVSARTLGAPFQEIDWESVQTALASYRQTSKRRLAQMLKNYEEG